MSANILRMTIMAEYLKMVITIDDNIPAPSSTETSGTNCHGNIFKFPLLKLSQHRHHSKPQTSDSIAEDNQSFNFLAIEFSIMIDMRGDFSILF